MMPQVITPGRIHGQGIINVNMVPCNRIRGFDPGHLTHIFGKNAGIFPGAFIKSIDMLQLQQTGGGLEVGHAADARVRVFKFFQQIIAHSRIHQGLSHQKLQSQGRESRNSEDKRSGHQR